MRKIAIILVCLLSLNAYAQQAPKKEKPAKPSYDVTKAASEIKIDGVLDEEAWQKAVVIPLPYEWFPGDNITPPVATDCLVTFDRAYLYVAFRALDPDPSKIRAHIMDRDSTDTFIQDDHVGLMLDMFNDERRAVQLRMNPLGVQMDAVFSEQDGIEDFSWDIIWDSKGKINQEGYAVEIAIPFNQLRFPSSAGPQTWGFEAFRSYPRSVRHRISTTYRDRDVSCLLCQEIKVTGFQEMTSGKNMEFDPTLTSSRTDTREPFPEGDLQKEHQDVEPGLTGRWGMTSSMTLNGTINPDFSQVEADVAQLDVNTRFALFFPEKRPFFLEGVDFFSTPFRTVFTRTVADPMWGAKVTGKQGQNGLGVFVTQDEINNLIFPSNQGSGFDSLDQDVVGSVFRYRRDLGSASTLGFLYSGREADGYHNRQVGIDGFNRLSDTDLVLYQYLHSDSEYPEELALKNGQPLDSFGGDAFYVEYDHNGRDWTWFGRYEDLGEDFRSDSGFIPRVDTRTIDGYLQRSIYGDSSKWFSRINFAGRVFQIEDHNGLLTDQSIRGRFDYQGPLQTFAEVLFRQDKEFFEGITYDLFRPSLYFEIKPSGSFSANVYSELGDTIDFANSRKANNLYLNPTAEVKVGAHVNLGFNHALQRLSIDEGTVFTANLSQFRLIYNFNTRAFIRGIIQYTDITRDPDLFTFPVAKETERVFTQFLFSYKLNPRTVLFAGYSDNYQGAQQIDLTQTNRTFFLKLGYAFIL